MLFDGYFWFHGDKMLSIKNFWRKHKRKIFVTVGVVGGGYFLYTLHKAHRGRLDAMEREFAVQRENDEFVKAQMQAHFEKIQMISDTITSPHAMRNLSSRIAEGLELSLLLERLIKGKVQPNTLPASEKLVLWDRLKILSFTRMALSVWAMTMLSLYIRVQVNILGRHMYIDTARSLGSSDSLDGADFVDREDLQSFLGNVDYLSNYGIPILISDMEASAKEVLKGKQLRDSFDTVVLHNTIMQILDTFMSMGSPHHWVNYMMPEDATSHATASSSCDYQVLSSLSKFNDLMKETRSVLSSAEFGSVVEISLKAAVNKLVEEMGAHFRRGSFTSGIPLAKVIPQVAQMCPSLLEEPDKNKFIQIIKNIPEVEFFFTLLYANMPTS